LLRRIAAMLYDALLLAALWFLATTPFIAVRGGEPVAANDNVLYRIVLLLVAYGFFVGFWTRKGRTLGMQSWGLQLESADGKLPSVSQASVRFFAAILSWLPAGLGFLWQLVDRDKLCWHDRLSGTRLRYYPKPQSGQDG
jgi:uncharacterized RDD family membrane protein YckC